MSDTPTEFASNPSSGRAFSAFAGILSAALALAIGELFSGFTSEVRSLVVGVADAIIDWTPGGVARWSIDLFGKNQKTMLVWGIVIVSLIIGGAVGRLAVRRPAVGFGVFGAFALVGGFTAARVPGVSDEIAWLSAIVAASAGALLLFSLNASINALGNVDAEPAIRSGGRRKFLNLAGGASLATLGAWTAGSILRNRFNVNAAREEAAGAIATRSEAVSGAAAAAPTATPMPPAGAPTEVTFDAIEGIAPRIVPNKDFYRIDTAVFVPQVDPSDWSMTIKGMVDTPLTLTYQDLLDRASVEEPVTLSCVSNPVGGDLVGNAVWLGVPLKDLLEEAGVQPGADQVASRSVDGWSCGFPTEVLNDPDRVALVAIAMNGEPLPVSHGFPARLVVAGLYGYVSATKWLSEIELTTWDDFDGYWIPRGWGKLGPVKTQSRIDVPRQAAKLDAGPQVIAGVAWAPHTGIEMVEVSVDDGPWRSAELIIEQSVNSWRQWKLDWDATPGQHDIKVRATDATGYTQTEERTNVAPDGATGHHQIAVKVA